MPRQPVQPRLGDRFEILGTVWGGEIVSLWAVEGDVQVLVEWDQETMNQGSGGDGKPRKLFMLSELLLSAEHDVWVERSRDEP